MVKYIFKQGIPAGAELICEDVFRNYADCFNETLKSTKLRMDLNIKECEGDVVREMYGGIMLEQFGRVQLGSIGNYPAVKIFKTDGTASERVLSTLPEEKWEEYNITRFATEEQRKSPLFVQRDCLIEYVDVMRGAGYRKRLAMASKYGMNLRVLHPGDYTVAMDVNLCQVNDMKDLARQIRDYADPEDDRWCKRLVYIEGITEMTDEEIMSFDFFNAKPDGHTGGGETYEDEDTLEDYEYGYQQSLRTRCYESATHVWMLRGEELFLFVDAEGYSYCKYLLMPMDFRESWKDVLALDDEKSDKIAINSQFIMHNAQFAI